VNGAARWLPLVGVTLAASAFAWWNRGERVVVDLGVATFYRAPLTLVVFLAFLFGMLSMLLLSLRHDLRVRRELQARGLLPSPPAAAPPFDPFAGPVPEGESAAIRVVPPAPALPSPSPSPAPDPHASRDGAAPL
jgi:uncharacterized integral membrane protein